MFKKIFTVGLLSALAVFAVPTMASAAEYGDGGDNGATIVVVPGQPAVLSFGGFLPGEPTTASAPDAVTLSTLKVVASASKPAGPAGTVSYTASATQPGSYTITVASATNVAYATFTIAPTDAAGGTGSGGGADGGLPNTGFETPMLIVWAATGALLLGGAMVFVMTVVRRNKKITQ